jgi:hypothetical protein
MTSICNYSYPELQITEGLVRQTSGRLFPYNPEFYNLASGLYGPGTIYCWYLLLVSVIINWFFHKKDDEGYRRPGVSNDLLAAFAYPVFAATDALIHALRILRMEYRALAILCLRMPKVELTGLGKFNDTQLDLRLPIPPNIVSLGQHAIDIGGPLPVCYTFMTTVFSLAVLYLAGMKEQFCWIPTKWARRLVCVTYGYVILVLTIFHLSLGDIGISMIIIMYEAILPFLLFLLFVFCTSIPILTLGLVIMFVEVLRERDRKKLVEALKSLGSFLFVVALAGYMIFCVYVNGVPLTPDVAVSITEKDQIAALLGGIVTLCFTLGHIFRSRIKEEKSEGEEMQRLASDVE